VIRLGVALALAAVAAGCGGNDSHTPSDLTVETWWNDSPSAVDQIGYQLAVDLVWGDRSQSCYPLSPNLKLHVNDTVAAPPIEGDCAAESLVLVNGFQGGTATVSLQDGDQVLGESVFDGLTPYAGATLVTPAAGQPVKAGDAIAVALPAAPADPTLAGARFYWTGTPSTVPPYYTYVPGTIAADGTTFQMTAPTTVTGTASVVIQTIFATTGNFVAASSCTGFQFCSGFPNFDMAGPLAIDVVP